MRKSLGVTAVAVGIARAVAMPAIPTYRYGIQMDNMAGEMNRMAGRMPDGSCHGAKPSEKS